MMKNTVVWSALALLVLAVAAAAQEPQPPPPGGGPHDVMFMGGPGPMGDDFGGGSTVKGSPLSGEIVIVRDTTLADGNKIHNESQAKVYRDAEGRVRREMGIGLGLAVAGSVKHNVITITDPVAGTRYVLNPDNKTARQTPLRGGPGGPGGPKGAMKDHAAHMKAMSASDVTKEQLGTKTINGVQAEGVRVTRTIPAGAMGNEKAISVVTERWYSPDLQMVVLMTHSDPMMGTITTKLVNVTQGAPDASLFQVPSDYTVKAGKAGDPMFMPMPR